MNLKKSEKTSVLIIVLVFISVISAGTVSVIYGVTKPIIEKQKEQKVLEAVKEVLPDCEKIEQKQIDNIDNKETYFEATKNNKIVGYAFSSVSNNGYAGSIKILMGIDAECKISGFQLLEHQETPGLGTKVGEDTFKKQFLGKSLYNFNFSVKKDGGEVDAVTAATISSKAVSEALELGLQNFSICK